MIVGWFPRTDSEFGAEESFPKLTHQQLCDALIEAAVKGKGSRLWPG